MTQLNPTGEIVGVYRCNEIELLTQTLNTRAGNPMTFSIGDTIRYEFSDPKVCFSDNIQLCPSIRPAINLSDFSFEYIIVPEDFQCN